jgi:phosphate transport system ATP-binding protein
MEKIKLKIENLNISYDNKKVINDVSCSFNEKEITCIIGASGCGKTTLLKSINRSIEYDENAKVSGNIFLNTNGNMKNIYRMNAEDLRRKVGIVSQIPVVFPFSIYKNLLYPLDYYTKLNKDEKKNIIIDVLKKVELYDEVKDDLERDAENLSGGQKQRLCIARTLLTEPEILLLDEPCSALDVKNQDVIEKMLLQLKNEITIIIVTHNIKEAEKLKDKIIFMDNGKIEDEGLDIIKNPKTENLKNFLNH